MLLRPFCGAAARKYTDDCLVVTHNPNCFLGIQGGAYTNQYIEGRNKIKQWNTRVNINLLLKDSNKELIEALEWVTEDMDMINSDKNMVSTAISNAQKLHELA